MSLGTDPADNRLWTCEIVQKIWEFILLASCKSVQTCPSLGLCRGHDPLPHLTCLDLLLFWKFPLFASFAAFMSTVGGDIFVSISRIYTDIEMAVISTRQSDVMSLDQISPSFRCNASAEQGYCCTREDEC